MLKTSANVAGTTTLMALGIFTLTNLPQSDRGGYPAEPGKYQDRGLRVIRPPSALENDDEFLASCIRCYRCQDACEPGAIQFFGERSDAHFQSPYIDPAIKACTLCMKCTVACPTDALSPMLIEEKNEARMATVALREDMCLSHKARHIRDEEALLMDLGRQPTESTAIVERRGPCGECYMFCPLRGKAITLEPGMFLAPVVHPEHCAGCGMCEDICRVMVRGEPAMRVVSIRGTVSG